MTKSQTSFPSSASSSKLGIDRGSHMISKPTKIRIIHIYTPEIIQTDAANFRELVQRLTGNKPEDEKTPSKTRHVMEKEQEFMGLKNGKRIKNEEEEEEEDDENEIWRIRSKSNERFSGFFDGFSELDGFMEELSTMPVVR